jgi:hypothetical protein
MQPPPRLCRDSRPHPWSKPLCFSSTHVSLYISKHILYIYCIYIIYKLTSPSAPLFSSICSAPQCCAETRDYTDGQSPGGRMHRPSVRPAEGLWGLSSLRRGLAYPPHTYDSTQVCVKTCIIYHRYRRERRDYGAYLLCAGGLLTHLIPMIQLRYVSRHV